MDPITGAAAVSAGVQAAKGITSAIDAKTATTSAEQAGNALNNTKDSPFLRQFRELSIPDSQASRDYYLGGSRDFARKKYEEMRQAAEAASRMQSAKADLSQDRNLAKQQFGLLDQYKNRYTGNAPSVAAMTAESSLGANARSTLAERSASPMNLAAQRAIMLQGAGNAANIGNMAAGQRSNEAFQASGQAGSLSNNMSSMAVRNGLRQAQLDLDSRKFGDALANEYYNQGREVVDAQSAAARDRVAALMAAAAARRSEVTGESERLAKEYNDKGFFGRALEGIPKPVQSIAKTILLGPLGLLL